MISVRPTIVNPPADLTTLVGRDAVLECGVSGDPTPHVQWRRSNGAKMPQGRIRSADSRTALRIERLTTGDRFVKSSKNSKRIFKETILNESII